MAFIKKVWKDRLAEFAGRRRIVDVDTGKNMVVDVSREEGLLTQVGDAFSANNMNDLEERISNGFSDCTTSSDVRNIVVSERLPPDAANHPEIMYVYFNK